MVYIWGTSTRHNSKNITAYIVYYAWKFGVHKNDDVTHRLNILAKWRLQYGILLFEVNKISLPVAWIVTEFDDYLCIAL